MSSLEETLSQVLGNPQMMQQIMNLAQSLGQQDQSASPPSQSPPSQSPLSPSPPPPVLPDGATVQKLAGLAGMAGVDKDQQALLRALGPYISRERRGKLERAMRAAKMAAAASEMLIRR
jgi:hypothetical protein